MDAKSEKAILKLIYIAVCGDQNRTLACEVFAPAFCSIAYSIQYYCKQIVNGGCNL